STISAFPSMTSRKARRSGTIVNGSNEAFSARQPTIKHSSRANPPKYTTGTTPTAYVWLSRYRRPGIRRRYGLELLTDDYLPAAGPPGSLPARASTAAAAQTPADASI